MNEIEDRLIQQVIPEKGRCLRLILCTGSELLLNMKNRLNTMRFFPLKDEAVFNSVTTDGFYLHFDTEQNYALDFTLWEAMRMAVSTPDRPFYQSRESARGWADGESDRQGKCIQIAKHRKNLKEE